MELICEELSYRTASLDARATLASSFGETSRWAAAAAEAEVAEWFVLSTCHRLEFYAAVRDAGVARARIAKWCSHPEFAAGAWISHTGVEAALHLCRVTAGLDSMIVGEAEIAGQVRRAATLARDAGTLGPYLERVIAGALKTSGRARSETRISEGVLSAASAAVTLATATLGSLVGRHVLVLGSGQMARTALTRLVRRKTGRLTVASRSLHHAREAAAIAGAEVCSLEVVPERLTTTDVVIAAIPGGTWQISRAQCEQAFAAAPHGTRVMVDLGVPRAIEATVSTVAGVRLFSVDDLGDIARQSATRREREVPVAEAIAADEAARAFSKFQARRRYDGTPTTPRP